VTDGEMMKGLMWILFRISRSPFNLGENEPIFDVMISSILSPRGAFDYELENC
jgi:hypothetical protein